MSKQMPVISVNKAVDPKRIREKMYLVTDKKSFV
jgi:hypothetical protein